MHNNFWLLLIFLAVFSPSCTGILKVDKEAGFAKHNSDIERIVTIDPEFEFLKLKSAKQKPVFNRSLKKMELANLLRKNAKRNGIDLDVIKADGRTTYFNDLAPLKREILQASLLMDFSDTTKMKRKARKASIMKFDEGPFISSKFSHLADEYSTPFFAVQGMTVRRLVKRPNYLLIFTLPPVGLADLAFPSVRLDYFTVVADVSRGQLVYAERRQVNSKATLSNLNTIIYDSFKIISN